MITIDNPQPREAQAMSDGAKVPEKRRFWQLHLITAVLMMFAAGGLLGASATERLAERGRYNTELWFAWVERGWPLAYQQTAVVLIGKDAPVTLEEVKAQWPDQNILYVHDKAVLQQDVPKLRPVNAAIDIGLSIALLCVLTVVCEWLIRRREGRKP